MSRTLLWTPSVNPAVTIESVREPFVLVGLWGESDTLAAPSGVQSPRQYGQTATGVRIGGRTLDLQVGIVGATEAAREESLAELIAAWADQPPTIGERPVLGTIRYDKPGQVPLFIAALPNGGPKQSFMDETREMAVYDCSLWCPDPRWSVEEDVTVDLTNEFGGFTFPFSMPFYMESFNTGGIVENPGSAPSSLLIRLWGEFTTGRLIDHYAERQIEVTGEVAAGDYVEISTAFGNKYVTLVEADGTRTNILGRYNLETSTFLQIPPGETFLRFEADDNVSGFAQVFFRPMFAGA